MEKLLLKHGWIADGTGNPGFTGDVMLEHDRILCVSETPLPPEDCRVIDCSGQVIAPGFIDCHSHQDRYLFYENELEMTEPFIRQGITTYVAGNCGFGVAGMEPGTPHREALISDPGSRDPNARLLFPTYADFFAHMARYGMRQNLALLAAHGVAAGSVLGMEPSGTLTPEIMRRIDYLLDEGMDAGCKGISFGLGYRPGNFFTDDQIRQASEHAIRRGKVIAVHERVMSLDHPMRPGEEPENVRWHREYIERFRDTGAKLQLSHLLFVGRSAFATYDAMMEMFDRQVETSGTDLWFDMYSYVQGVSGIQVLLPQVFYSMIPALYDNRELLSQFAAALNQAYADIGVPPSDIQLCNGIAEEYAPYRGMFMDEIMKARGVNVAELYTDLYRKTNGYARIYFYCEQDEANIPRQMLHPRALYMTDASVAPGCHQNQAAYGAMPKFLRLAREGGRQTLEETVAKMTGRAALRFDLKRRGFLRPGYYADLVVFDGYGIADRATPQKPDTEPLGISHVFVNGSHLLDRGRLNRASRSGMLA